MKKELKAVIDADYSIQPIVIPSANLAAKPLLGDALGSLPNFHEKFMKDMYRKVTAEWDAKLKAYIQENLKQFGYAFETEAEFFEFCKNRVHRIGFENKPNEWEFYLDYVDAENTGKLIGICSDKIDFKMEGNTATVTIGKSIG
jgi:hypothetical protein